MLERVLRPLTRKEAGRLERQLGAQRAALERVVPRHALVGFFMVAVLCMATIAASPVPWWIIVAFWAVLGAGLFLWVTIPEYSKVKDAVYSLEDALRRNEAEVFHVQTNAFVEFEEVEDLGACYAFQVGAGDIVFISGQDFYPTRVFPSTDFSIVQIYDSNRGVVDLRIEATGKKLKPVRKLGAEIQANLRVPDNFETVRGWIEDLESVLQVEHAPV